jgi:hypothetical protein
MWLNVVDAINRKLFQGGWFSQQVSLFLKSYLSHVDRSVA